MIDSYGLPDFSYEKLYQRQIPKPAFKVEYREPVPVIFQKRKLKKLTVAIPLLMAMALIPMKNNKEYLSKSDMGLWENLIESTPTIPAPTEEQNVAQFDSETIAPANEEFKYFIIGGSFKSEENANKYIEQLSAKGYTGKNLGIFKGLHRVAMKGFSTMEEAQKELNSILYQNPQSGVWISANE
ncbi:MAG: SPOR domain-containing protein [Prolixibacteraceae bacterium]|nr:SPOR domain-containing protein [Prolixibacteraceae bacterium]